MADYQAFKQKKLKKRILFIVLALFISFNSYGIFTSFKRIYLVEHAYPEAKKWEFMASVVRWYGYIIAKNTSLDERDWLIKKFIAVEHNLLDEAAQYIPDDDLEKHLRIWNLFDSYQAWNNNTTPLLYKKIYSQKETENILEDFWKQFEYMMNLETRGLFYQVEKFKVWISLSYIYIYI